MLTQFTRKHLLQLCAILCAWPSTSFAIEKIITIETLNNALVLSNDKSDNLILSYFGKKLKDSNEYIFVSGGNQLTSDYSGLSRSIYTPSGSKNLLEPAISIVHSDGNKSLDLRYVSHKQKKIDNNRTYLEILLKDPVYNFSVTLHFESYYNEDVIEQWTTISHQENGTVILKKYASANLSLQSPTYYLRQYHGDWAKEMQPEDSRLTHGIKIIDSKLGTRANLFQPSSFMISLGSTAKEYEGQVLFGTLAYSGNFKIEMELDQLNTLRILAGINNYASDYTLAPMEKFVTPKFIYTLSHKGKSMASQNLHNWARKYKILQGEGERLSLLNNWEATYFDFNEEKLKELIKDTKKLGVDLFLLDDGWFANKYPRNNDQTGLGDWQPNKAKLPNGITNLVKEATANGVKFGIWVEPEMVSPKSELYEKHPDWVIKQNQREEHYFRNQLVLDLANPKVQDFVYNMIDGLFNENPELAYIKWDCNSVIFNAHSNYLKNQDHFYIEYMRGLYRILERIRSKYPTVPMMLCSGGGGRVDYGALQYFTEFWPSDNTDPLERIFMQYEYSYFYPSIAVSNHVTDWGKQSLKFRTDVAMMGKLGFDIVVKNLNTEDLSFAQNAVGIYNNIKDIIWEGNLFRLADPREGDFASLLYVDSLKQNAVVFNYLVNYRYGEGSDYPIIIKGLDPNKKYRVEEINSYSNQKSPINSNTIYSGDFLMTVGFNPILSKDRPSVILKITATE
jgi:Alpha-galactosidase